jgi:hypothetical protein
MTLICNLKLYLIAARPTERMLKPSKQVVLAFPSLVSQDHRAFFFFFFFFRGELTTCIADRARVHERAQVRAAVAGRWRVWRVVMQFSNPCSLLARPSYFLHHLRRSQSPGGGV